MERPPHDDYVVSIPEPQPSVPDSRSVGRDQSRDQSEGIDNERFTTEGKETWGGELNKSPGGRLQGSFLTWKNVNYSIEIKSRKERKEKENIIKYYFRSRFTPKVKTTKEILRNCSGYVKPGTMLALMGASGSGKSTLLDVLAGRKSSGKQSGEILTNGHERNKFFRKNVGYVEQFDILIATLTPRELLNYAALFRLDRKIPVEEKRRRVEVIIRDLGLTDCADTIIGDVGTRGISGGQAKRVNIGTELVSNPPILFLDEPTSGLDSATSFEVIKIIRMIANSGRAVICTIHQPGTDLFNLFDRLLLLIDGHTAYYGKAQKTVPYFQSLGYVYTGNLNPAEYIISVASADPSKQEALGIKGPGWSKEQLIQNFEGSERVKKLEREVDRINKMQDPDLKQFSDPFGSDQRKYPTGPFYSFWILSKRNFKSSMRDSTFIGTRVIRNVAFAILTATYFWGLGHDQDDLFNRLGSLFYLVTFAGFGSIVFLSKIIEGRPLFNRERHSGAYRTATYYFGLLLLEMPFLLISVILVSIITYWPIGYKPEAGPFFFFLFVLAATFWTATTFAVMIAAISPNFEVATSVLPVVMSIFLTLSGFFLRDIPVYWQWASFLSFWRYAFEALAVNELTGETFECGNVTAGCIETGEQQLEILGFEDVDMWLSVLYVWCFGIGFLIIGYFFTRFVRWEKR